MKWFEFSRRAPGWPAWRILFWWGLVRGLIRLSCTFAYRFRMFGSEHVPLTGPIIYAANHQSHLDPPIVGVLVTDRPFAGLARSTLFDSKLLGWMMRGIGVISLERGKGDTAAVKAAIEELAAGRCVLIFPEGTRTRNGTLGEFHRGIVVLVRRSGAPVVPVAVEGAFDIWPIGAPRPRLTGRLAVQCGRPISAQELLEHGSEAGLARLRDEIESMRLELRRRMRRESGGRHPRSRVADLPSWSDGSSPDAGSRA